MYCKMELEIQRLTTDFINLKDIIGKKAIKALEKGTPVSWDIIE